MKPFAESSEQNKLAILGVLERYLANIDSLLEVGSGTGQHGVFFAEKFPGLTWQCSDREEYLPGIRMWIEEAGLSNLPEPLSLDVNNENWSGQTVNAVFSANTVHIMDWASVEKMFSGIGNILLSSGVFLLYGPFNYNGTFTSESNARFDQWLKARDPESGVRDFEALNGLAIKNGLELIEDVAMPANNRTLVWKKI